MRRITKSLCPLCLKVIKATIYDENNKVYITKTCPEHGEYTDLYWGDYDLYQQAEKYAINGVILQNPRTKQEKGCPYDCGICTNHKSTTTLGIIDVTNRCNLRCPICFAHAGAAGYLYEPTVEQIRSMIHNLLDNNPIRVPALQFSGGEPTVREDLPALIEMAKEMGIVHVEVDSNGIKMAESVEYCKILRKAGADTVYLQFDGLTPEPYLKARGFNLLPIKLRAIENLKKSGFHSIVLVPVLIRGVNDNQIGDIVRFAIENKDCIRAVNFQPVSITGRISREERDEMRITIPDLIIDLEEQTQGLVKKSDWYPIPSVQPITEFIGHMRDKNFVDFCCHPHCGMATYLFIDGDKVSPITDYLNVDETLAAFTKANDEIKSGHNIHGKLEVANGVISNVKFKLLVKYLIDVVKHGDYKSLDRIHHQMIMIGSMHFMDPYNFDLDRVQRCIINYATPDGRIIPFCTMNTLHRSSVEKKYAKPLSADKLTPLIDVEALTKKILEQRVD